MTKQYYECHITMEGRPEDIRPHVEKFKWKFSAIDGDPTLGDGIKCYATRHFNCKLGDELVLHNLQLAALFLEAVGIKIVRRKIEKVIYDDRLETVKCTGGCEDCHVDERD